MTKAEPFPELEADSLVNYTALSYYTPAAIVRSRSWPPITCRISPRPTTHAGGESRIVPLFPEIRPHLEAAFDLAEPGTEHVITHSRDSNVNLRSRMLDIIWAAGLKEWPKLFQNLRSTRETELAEIFPMHVVCKWIGNSQPVAAKHYLQVTDDHFDRAIQGDSEAAQYVHEMGSKAKKQKTQTPIFTEVCDPLLYCTDVHVPPRGVEPLSSD